MRFSFGGYLEAEDIDDAISVLAKHLQNVMDESSEDDGVTDFEIVPVDPSKNPKWEDA